MNRIFLFLSVALIFSACGTSKKTTKGKQAYMSETYSELKKGLPEAEIQLFNDTIKVLFPESLLFDLGKAEVRQTNYASLEKFAQVINKYSKSKILITGYTDNAGEEEVNQALSENRSFNTKKVLIQNNVEEERIFTWGRGTKNPIASNKTAEGRKKNRRVEFVVLYEYAEK